MRTWDRDVTDERAVPAVSAHRFEPAVSAHRFEDDGRIPNNPSLPLLVYPGALETDGDLASGFERLFAAHGWGGSWRNGIYNFAHFHSTAHEVLGIARGRVHVRLGGAAGLERWLEAGDAVVIPAGVGHQNLGEEGRLLVIGAYPSGQEDWDLCRGDPSERPRVLQNIKRVPLPETDPIGGARGPLLIHWQAAR